MYTARINTRRLISGLILIPILVAFQTVETRSTHSTLLVEDELDLDDWNLEAPGIISIQQALESMSLDAANRFGFQSQPLVDSGYFELAVSAIPEEQTADFEDFVDASGFVPEENVTGFLLSTNEDFDEDEKFHMNLLVGLNDGANVHDLLKYLKDAREERESDEEEGDDSNTDLEVVFTFLSELDTEDMQAIFNAFANELADTSQVVTKEQDDALLAVLTSDEHLGGVYIWEGGAILTLIKADSDASHEVVREALASQLSQLSAAASVDSELDKSGLVFETHGKLEGVEFRSDLHITEVTSLTLDIEVPNDSLDSIQTLVQLLPLIQASPAMLKQFVPEEYLELAESLIGGVRARLHGVDLEFEIDVDNDVVEGILEDL